MLVGHGARASRPAGAGPPAGDEGACSVWMVPEGLARSLSAHPRRRSTSPSTAADTLQVAVALARASGAAECLALHVYFNEAVTTYEEYDQVLRGQEAEAYEKFVAPIDCQGVRVTPLFEEGANVAHVIGRVAEREAADLIVMATRGRSRSAAILLGSVTEETIIETRVPLLAVKHFGAADGRAAGAAGPRFLCANGLHTD